MAEDNPEISVDFLKQNYPEITRQLNDEDLEEIVRILRRQKIRTKRNLEFVSREALFKADVSVLFLDIIKPFRGKPLCCRSQIYC